MSYHERDIKWEGNHYWVLANRNSFDVMEVRGTHSVTLQSFAKTEDGLSLANYYAQYKERRKTA